jgi:transketolase
VRMIYGSEGSAGHFGGSMSAAEIVSVLYYSVLNIDPKRPDWRTGIGLFSEKGTAYPLFMRLWRIRVILTGRY